MHFQSLALAGQLLFTRRFRLDWQAENNNWVTILDSISHDYFFSLVFFRSILLTKVLLYFFFSIRSLSFPDGHGNRKEEKK